MRFGDYTIQRPGRLLACTALIVALGMGFKYALHSSNPVSVGVVAEAFEEESVPHFNVPLDIDEFWNDLSLDDQVYLIKSGYFSLPEEERKQVSEELFSTLVEDRYDSISLKIKTGLRYVVARINGYLEKPNYEEIVQNHARLTNFFGGKK